MSVPDEIDDLIGVLRSPALPSELADEHRLVAAMAEAFKSSEGKNIMRSSSRRVRIGVLIATGIIGFGGVAAAGPGGVFDNDDEVVDESTTTTTEVVDESTTTVAEGADVTTTVAEVPEAETTVETPEEAPVAVIEAAGVEDEPVALVDDPDTVFDETMCLDGNHGKTVSAVARGELAIPGIEVRDAAHSSCGKMDASVEPEDAVDSEDAVDEPVIPTETQVSAKEKPGKGKGNSNSNGNGNGNGNGNANGKAHGNGKGG